MAPPGGHSPAGSTARDGTRRVDCRGADSNRPREPRMGETRAAVGEPPDRGALHPSMTGGEQVLSARRPFGEMRAQNSERDGR